MSKVNEMFSSKRNGTVVFALILVFVALGCVQKEVKVDPNDGLKISEFFIDPDDVESGDTFRIYGLVENVGGTTAGKVDFEVFGISWEQNKIFLFTNKDLTPPDAFRNKAGGAAFGQKTFTAAQLPEGLTHTFNIVGRAIYDYSTSGGVSIPVFSKAEFDRRKLKGEPLPTFTVSNSDAPIKIDISGSSPIITGSGELFYKIHLRNVGSGVPITNDITGLITGEIKISGGAGFVECLGYRGSKAVLPADRAKGILLRKGESVDIPCSISLDEGYWQQRSQGTLLLTFDLKYRYYTEKEASLTVHGKRFEAGKPVDITQPPYGPTCGNGICESGETSITCPTDCAGVSECGFLPDDPGCKSRYLLMGLYRYRESKPFGNWCSNIIEQVRSYYQCISGCFGIFVGPYDTPLDPLGIPQQNECR